MVTITDSLCKKAITHYYYAAGCNNKKKAHDNHYIAANLSFFPIMILLYIKPS